jgi:hypothetical protein
MIPQVTFNREKWMASLMLDPITGLDPPGVKVRVRLFLFIIDYCDREISGC